MEITNLTSQEVRVEMKKMKEKVDNRTITRAEWGFYTLLIRKNDLNKHTITNSDTTFEDNIKKIASDKWHY